MTGVNANDIVILERYANNGQRLAYWDYVYEVSIRETGKNNDYAVLAKQVVLNDTFEGAVANRYAAGIAAEKGIHMTPSDQNQTGLEQHGQRGISELCTHLSGGCHQ